MLLCVIEDNCKLAGFVGTLITWPRVRRQDHLYGSPEDMESEAHVPEPNLESKPRNSSEEIKELYEECFGSVFSALSQDLEDDLQSIDSLYENHLDSIPPPEQPCLLI